MFRKLLDSLDIVDLVFMAMAAAFMLSGLFLLVVSS